MTKDQVALATLMPGSLSAGNGDGDLWQQRKSRETRNMILEAALDCLAQGGYAGCSLQIVADKATISRGAMLHHYSSKLDLIAAVIEFAFYKRLEDFLSRVSSLTEDERTSVIGGARIAYESCSSAAYRAYLALHIASRVDPELRPIFLERAEMFDVVWRERVLTHFPEWLGHERFEFMNDFIWAIIEGTALNADIWSDPQRAAGIVDFAAQIVRRVWLREIDLTD